MDEFERPERGWFEWVAKPEKFVLFDPENRNLRFDEAIQRFSTDRLLAARYAGLLFTEELTPSEILDFLDYRSILTRELIVKLHNGDLVATGFCEGELTLITVPKAWWCEVTVDMNRNEVRAHGTTICAIRVADGTKTAPSKARIRKVPKDAALSWMRQRAQQELDAKGRLLKRDDIIQQCAAEAGVKWEVATWAYGELPEQLRNRHGRPKQQPANSGK